MRSGVPRTAQNGVMDIEAKRATVKWNGLADHMLISCPRMQRQALRARNQQKRKNGQRGRLERRVSHSIHSFIDANSPPEVATTPALRARLRR